MVLFFVIYRALLAGGLLGCVMSVTFVFVFHGMRVVLCHLHRVLNHFWQVDCRACSVPIKPEWERCPLCSKFQKVVDGKEV